MDLKEKKLDSTLIYDGKVLHIYKDKVLCANGNESYREIVKHNGGAAILFINDKNEVALVKQYRYAYDEVMYEIPAGKLEVGEIPYDAALRELEEETGYKASSLVDLGIIYPSCGYTSEKIHLFLAENVKKSNMHLDFDECIEVYFINYDKLKNMILSGEIKDAKTISAVLKYELLKNR